MRAKLLDRGPDALADYELLEMLLFLGISRGDTKPLAKTLMNQFGSLDGLLGALPSALDAAGLNGRLRSIIGVAAEAGRRLTNAELDRRPHLSTVQGIASHLRSRAAAAGPTLTVLHLNNSNRLVREQRLTVNMPAESVAKGMGEDAIRHHASAVVIVAMRGGRPRCLPRDLEVLQHCEAASLALSVVLHDYLIVGDESELSLRQAGLM
jgi:DNA repair protein RadC